MIRPIPLIAARELRERLRAKSFTVLTGVLVLVILAIGVITRIAGGGEDEARSVGVVEPVPDGFDEALVRSGELAERPVEVVGSASADAARRAVEDGDLDAAVLGDERQLVFADGIDNQLRVVVDQAWASAQAHAAIIEAGLTADEAAAILTPQPLEAVSLDDDDAPDAVTVLTGTLAAIMLFIAIQTFGNYVLMGVTEEKSTAVVEVLLARVRSDQLLAGKVIGIGLAAMIQFTAAVAAGLASLQISGQSVPGEVWSALPVTLVWFVGGYAFYSTLFALAGSLVSRQEDAQAAAAPISTVLIGAYLLVFIFGYAPDSTATTVMSLIPPLAPMIMPMRMAAGAAPVWQVVLAIVLLAVAIVAVWKLAGKVYEQVLLRRGQRISWKEVASLARRERSAA